MSDLHASLHASRIRALTRAMGVAALVLLILPATVRAQPEVDVLQGGFRIFDPEAPRNREVDVLSLGPLVLGGARARTNQPDFVFGRCSQLLFALIGNEKAQRSATSVKVQQKDHVVAFFVFEECTGEDSSCVLGASEPVAVEGCSGAVSVSTKKGIAGKGKIQCKNGIDPADPAFGLSVQEQGWASEDFPDVAGKFSMSFSDKAAEEVEDPDFSQKIMNLDPDALDDVVGTYLADDALPPCP